MGLHWREARIVIEFITSIRLYEFKSLCKYGIQFVDVDKCVGNSHLLSIYGVEHKTNKLVFVK